MKQPLLITTHENKLLPTVGASCSSYYAFQPLTLSFPGPSDSIWSHKTASDLLKRLGLERVNVQISFVLLLTFYIYDVVAGNS
jgi:hypothetical protein